MWFAVLGRIDVRDEDGVGLAPTAPRLLSLLSALLCRPNQAVSVDRLVDLVWDGRPSRSAHSSLQVYVHRLRLALGEDRVLRDAPGYRLVVEPHEFDVACFEERARAGRRVRQQGEPERAAALFTQALSYWRGELPYDGLPDTEAVLPERARLSELRLSVLEWRMDAALAAGVYADLVDELRALVERYPHRQRFQAQLMLALWRAGLSVQALAVYDRAEQILVESYGLEPGSPLRELRQRILDGASSDEAASGDDIAALAVGAFRDAATDEGGARPPLGDASADRSDAASGAVRVPAGGSDTPPDARADARDAATTDAGAGARAGVHAATVRMDGEAGHQRPPVGPAGPDGRADPRRTADPPGPSRGRSSDSSIHPHPGPSAASSAPGAVRCTVPEPDSRLVGRERELTTVLRHLATRTEHPSPTTPVVAIAGQGGVGKSALARWAARELADCYPDGQLYVNLRGGTEVDTGHAGVEPIDALARLLTDLGEPPNAVPGSEDEASARFRSLTAGRRMLVVLDDAYDTSQVRPLLPGADGPGVLVTSRRALTALDDTEVVTLAPLSRQQAIDLLAETVGDDRVAADPVAAGQVTQLSGGLPLAIRIVGARLAARPELPLAALATRLREGRGRLDEWEHAEQGVRASFALGYQALSAAAAEMFDQLGVVELPEVDVGLMAAVTGRPGTEVRRRLDELVDARLLNPVPGKAGRFGLHDLLRLYARERAEARTASSGGSPTGREALGWIRRAVHFYIATGRAATERFTNMAGRRRRIGIVDEQLLTPGSTFADNAEAVDWTRTEADNMVAAMRLACVLPGQESGAAAGLAAALTNPLYVQASYRSLIELNRLAAKAVSAGSDPEMYTVIERDLASAYLQIGQPSEALAYYRRERDGCELREDHYGMAVALQGIGLCLRELPGERPAAAEAFTDALGLHRLIGNQVGEGSALNNLANLRLEDGDVETARELFEQVCEIHARTGERGRLAAARANLAEVHHQAGRLEEAATAYAEVVAELRTAGYSRIEMIRRWDLGDVLHQLGRPAEARQRWREALDLAVTLGVLAPEQIESVLADSEPVRPRALVVT